MKKFKTTLSLLKDNLQRLYNTRKLEEFISTLPENQEHLEIQEDEINFIIRDFNSIEKSAFFQSLGLSF